jgi:transposase
MTRKSAPKDPKPVGRPSKFTDDVKTRIVKGIKLGMSYELASQYGGISYDTFNEWRKRGEAEGEGPYYDFSEDIKSAEAEGLFNWLDKIENAANEGQWQAAAWKAERRFPDMYGKQRIEHTGKDGGPIILKTGMSLDDL